MDNKAKFGRNFYYATIIISIVILVLAIIFFNVRNIEDEELILTRYVYRYSMIISVLYIIIPLGCIVREITLGDYKKGLIIFKIFLAVFAGVGAILLVYFTKNMKIAKIATMVGALVLVFSVSPTKPPKKEEK